MTLWLAAAGLIVVAAGLVLIAGRDGGDDERAELSALPIGSGSGSGAGTADRATAESAADMTFAPAGTYVPGDGLPDLGGEATAYRLTADVDRDAVAGLADALGVEGDPTETDGSWHVGSPDGGGPALDVYGPEGMWSYYDYAVTAVPEPAAAPDQLAADAEARAEAEGSAASGEAVAPADDPVRPCPPVDQPLPVEPDGGTGASDAAVDPAVEPVPTDEGGGTSGSPGCEVPVEPLPLPTEPYEPPARPEDLPSEDEARTIALDLLEATGADVEDAEVRVEDGITEWFVSVEPTVGGVPAPGLAMYVGVGDGGRITSASGTLGTPEALGDYPLLDTGDALDRLNESRVYLGPAVDPAAADAATAREGAAEPAVDPATDPTVAVDEPAVVPSDPGDDLPVLTPPTIVVEPGPDRPPATEPGPDTTVAVPETTVPETTVPTEGEPAPVTTPIPAPPDIPVTDAELILVSEVAWDGSGTYLVPGYRFSAEDGSDPVVAAVVDALVDPPPADDPVTDPGPDMTIEPPDVAEGGGDPGTVDPDTPAVDTPAGDPATRPEDPSAG